jgi:hypothetical protein
VRLDTQPVAEEGIIVEYIEAVAHETFEVVFY